MAFKVFAPGVLTSSDVNTFLMRQAVITCTSSTRPASPSEGMTIYETDTDLYRVYDGSNWIEFAQDIAGAWTVFTPSWNNLTVGNGTNDGYVTRIGRITFMKVQFTFGSTSSVTGQVSLNYPTGYAAAGGIAPASFGLVSCEDDSTTISYPGQARVGGSEIILQTMARLGTDKVAKAGLTATSPITFDTGDIIRMSVAYESEA